MKKNLFFLLLLIGLGATAQNHYISKNDPDATAILKKVTARYKTLKTLSASVVLSVENNQGQKMKSQSGTIFIKGNKYYLEMGNDVSFSDGSNVYNLDKSVKEIQVTRFNPNGDMITPQKLFTDFYKKDFLYKLNGESVKSGRTVQEIELTPVDKTQVYFKILLDVDKGTRNILGATLFEKNGTRYKYAITDQKSNVSIPDSKFIYSASAYPGIELIDLR